MNSFFKKNFGNWFDIKPKIHEKKSTPQYLHEGDMFWYHCGENIGTEICGKGKDSFRPCIIYKVLSRSTVVIIPLSTKINKGSWYVPITSLKRSSVACLHQIISIDTKRLHRKMGEVSQEERGYINEQFSFLYTKINPLDKI